MNRHWTSKLGDHCDFINGGTPSKTEERFWNGDIPWITSADIADGNVLDARSKITEEALERSATNLVPAGTILLVSRTGVGKVAQAPVELAFSQDITAIVPRSGVIDARYLLRFLETRKVEFERSARGATIKGITRDLIASQPILLPPLDEQRRIAAILDKADALRQKRRRAIALLDSLAQSFFLEMFGDPVSNPRQWRTHTLGELHIPMIYGPRFYNEAYSPDGIRIVRITDLDSTGQLDFDAMPRLALTENERRQHQTLPGEILFARTGATVGKIALIEKGDPISVPGAYFIRLTFPDSIDPVFAAATLRSSSIQKIIAEGSRQSAQQNFSGPGLRRLPFIIPPLELQMEYAKRVGAVKARLAGLRADASRFDALFASLQHRAYSSQL